MSQATPNVVRISASQKPAIVRKHTRATRAVRRQAGTAIGIGAVAVTLTTLSLSHLAHGITIVTGAEGWQSWAMAVGIGLGFVALELAQVATVAEKVREQVARFARPAIVGTLAGSAGIGLHLQRADFVQILWGKRRTDRRSSPINSRDTESTELHFATSARPTAWLGWSDSNCGIRRV
jgi:hypothetical protein